MNNQTNSEREGTELSVAEKLLSIVKRYWWVYPLWWIFKLTIASLFGYLFLS